MGFLSKLFGRGDGDDGVMPTLGEAWRLLAPEYSAQVDERGPESIAVQGTTRGRRFTVDIESKRRWNEALVRMNESPRRREPYRQWHTELIVECTNPHRLAGNIVATTDGYGANRTKLISSDNSVLTARVLPAVRDRLAKVLDDVTIEVQGPAVRLIHDDKAKVLMGYFGGSPIHFPVGPIVPWPDRAIVGTRWWINMFCDIADIVDG